MAEDMLTEHPVPDFTLEHWGIYESPRLESLSQPKFREFVINCFGGRDEEASPDIHGSRGGVPLYVGQQSRQSKISKDDVVRFANAIFTGKRGNLGVMLGWNISQDAKTAADILKARENKRIDFVRLSLVRLEDDEFREHVKSKHKEYHQLLTFIQPPELRIKYRRIAALKYEFDVSESLSLNKDGVIANVQWDFDYTTRFSSTEGYGFLRDKSTGKPILVVEYEFPKAGTHKIACSIQDDLGGERTVIMDIETN